MQGRERILTVLNGGEPDEVPIGELGIDAKVFKGFGKGYRNEVDFALGEGLSLITAIARFNKIHEQADGCWQDEWGCTYGIQTDVMAHPIKGPISLDTDLSKFPFPDPDSPWRLGKLKELVDVADGRIAINFHGRVAFMWSVYLMGMDNLLMAMALEPEFVHELFCRVADINIKVLQNAVKAGADTVSLGDDYCSNQGPLMSPAMFREFILPHLQRAIDSVHAAGAKCIKHCDGNLWPILEDLVGTGVDCINPLEPVANMDMAEVKERYGKHVCMMGNIDCGDLLSNGSLKEVEQAVIECIRKGGSGGGLILSSSNSIHSGVSPANYAAMITTARQFGRYPLHLPPAVNMGTVS